MRNPGLTGTTSGPALGPAMRMMIPGLAAGHTVFHRIVQSLVVVLPEIRQAFQLNSVGVAGVLSARELASGMVALPGGVVVDVHANIGGGCWLGASR